MDHFDNPLAFFVALFGAGFGGIMLALLILLVILLVFLSPLIVVYLIYRLLKSLHNDKVRLTEKAIASGRPIAKSSSTTVYGSTDQELWNKGVKNVALGLGLIMLFGFWGAYALCGIGALIMCLGIGKMVIARTSRKVEVQHADDNDTIKANASVQPEEANTTAQPVDQPTAQPAESPAADPQPAKPTEAEAPVAEEEKQN